MPGPLDRSGVTEFLRAREGAATSRTSILCSPQHGCVAPSASERPLQMEMRANPPSQKPRRSGVPSRDRCHVANEYRHLALGATLVVISPARRR